MGDLYVQTGLICDSCAAQEAASEADRSADLHVAQTDDPEHATTTLRNPDESVEELDQKQSQKQGSIPPANSALHDSGKLRHSLRIECEDTRQCSSKLCTVSQPHCMHNCTDWNFCDQCKEASLDTVDNYCHTCEGKQYGKPKHCSFNCPIVSKWNSLSSIFFAIIGVVLFLVDVQSDVSLAVELFSQGDVVWAGLTTALIAIPGLLCACLITILLSDLEDTASALLCIGCFFSGTFLLSPVLFTVRKCQLWRKIRRKSCCHNEFLKEQLHNENRIQTFETLHVCVESAPQLLLQLYIVFSSQWEGATYKFALQMYSATSALLSVAWACAGLYVHS